MSQAPRVKVVNIGGVKPVKPSGELLLSAPGWSGGAELDRVSGMVDAGRRAKRRKDVTWATNELLVATGGAVTWATTELLVACHRSVQRTLSTEGAERWQTKIDAMCAVLLRFSSSINTVIGSTD